MIHRSKITKGVPFGKHRRVYPMPAPWFLDCYGCKYVKWFQTWEAAMNSAINHYETKRWL